MTWCVNKKILKAIDWTLRIAPELFYPFNGRPHRSQVHEERLAADSGRSSGSWFVLLLTPSRPGRLGALGQWPIVRFVPTHSGGTARELHPFPYARIYAFCALNLKRRANQSQGNSGRMRNWRSVLDNRYAMLTAFGQDRPGIVVALAEGLYHLGCNIEDTCMTRLRDEFAMMLLVRLPAGLAPDQVPDRLTPKTGPLRLTVLCREVSMQTATRSPTTQTPNVMLSVYGADRPGIVAAVARVGADNGGNITGPNRRKTCTPGSTVYAIVLEIHVPGG